MPRLLVTDANILIDLALANNCDLLVLDGYRIVVSIDVFYELNHTQKVRWQPYADDGRLLLEEADEQTVALLRSQYSASLSDADLTFFALLQAENWTVLSGDQKLVKACQSAGYDAHGLLWLFDQHAAQSVNYAMLYNTLAFIMSCNDRLPQDECNKRLTKWGG